MTTTEISRNRLPEQKLKVSSKVAKKSKVERDSGSAEKVIFRSLDAEKKGTIFRCDLIDKLDEMGIRTDDIRLKEFFSRLKQYALSDQITFEQFSELLGHSGTIVQKALQGRLIIPDFSAFCGKIEQIFEKAEKFKEGKVADYIPQLKRVHPEQFGVSVCTIDGQRFTIGDTDKYFSIQSTCKPINYCLALEEHGEERVHRHVGREPSGHSFNELTLNPKMLPHNPMINAGAIMSASLVKPKLDSATRFDYVLDAWRKLSGGMAPSFNNAVYLSEKDTADRNFALAYFMRENKAFPENTDILKTLELYFQCCSIEMTAESMSVVASTLASAGICPLTGERVFQEGSVKHCLSLIYSCGMYDFSGEFAFSMGLPAKSGVGGGLMIVIPNVMGICVWSPRLDTNGNSVRGIEFARELVKIFNFHNYDSLISGHSKKIDPRLRKNETKLGGVMLLCWAAAQGDLREVKQLIACKVDINEPDYDGRTPLHLAASEGHTHIIEYFVSQGVRLNPSDRWGGTPLTDAIRENHSSVVDLLKRSGARNTS